MKRVMASRPALRMSFALVMALVAVAATAQVEFDEIIFFGDSLTDPGNGFVVTGEVSLPPFEPIPSYPYARGGKHLSNGATWAEQLAKSLQMNKSAKPALRVPGLFTNYATGAARARPSGPFHLSIQVGLFAQDFPAAPTDALYSIMIGGNDVRDALAALQTDPTGATSALIIEEAVLTVAANLSSLVGMGANKFVIADSPDLGLAPAVRAQGPLAQFYATQFSMTFNLALDGVLDSLEATPGVTVARLGLFQLLNEIVADPQAFGLENVIEPCLTFYVRKGAYCPQPDDYLFWDAIHPTRATHAILAARAMEALN